MRAKINPDPNTIPPTYPPFSYPSKESDHYSSLESVHLNAPPSDIVLFPSCKDLLTQLTNRLRQESIVRACRGSKTLGFNILRVKRNSVTGQNAFLWFAVRFKLVILGIVRGR